MIQAVRLHAASNHEERSRGLVQGVYLRDGKQESFRKEVTELGGLGRRQGMSVAQGGRGKSGESFLEH